MEMKFPEIPAMWHGLLEKAVIALIVAIITLWGSDIKRGQKVDSINTNIDRVEKTICDLQSEFKGAAKERGELRIEMNKLIVEHVRDWHRSK